MLVSKVFEQVIIENIRRYAELNGVPTDLLDSYITTADSVESPIIHRLRKGAPDKFNIATFCNEIGHDKCNLVNFTDEQIQEIVSKTEYILPADEGDILRANLLPKDINQQYILLPQTKEGRVIDYNIFVPKDSKIYEDISKETDIKYMSYIVVEPSELMTHNRTDRKAYKTTTGSGSRGVILVDPDRLYLGQKYREELTDEDIEQLIRFAYSEQCNIMVQDLIPNKPELFKVNVDFVIKDGKLLGYKWDEVNQLQQFTNWDNGYFIRNEFTDEILKQITLFLVKHGIWNAIMNFEAFSNNLSEIYLVEFNWRYSNSMFEWQALNIDPVYNYIENINFMDAIPMDSKLQFSRNWQCCLYIDLPHVIGI